MNESYVEGLAAHNRTHTLSEKRLRSASPLSWTTGRRDRVSVVEIPHAIPMTASVLPQIEAHRSPRSDEPASTMTRRADLMASGSVGQASTTRPRSASISVELLGLLLGRERTGL